MLCESVDSVVWEWSGCGILTLQCFISTWWTFRPIFFYVQGYSACMPLTGAWDGQPRHVSIFFFKVTPRVSCCFPVPIYADWHTLGRVMGNMWVFLGHLTITEKSIAVTRGIEPRSHSSPLPCANHSAIPTLLGDYNGYEYAVRKAQKKSLINMEEQVKRKEYVKSCLSRIL